MPDKVRYALILPHARKEGVGEEDIYKIGILVRVYSDDSSEDIGVIETDSIPHEQWRFGGWHLQKESYLICTDCSTCEMRFICHTQRKV